MDRSLAIPGRPKRNSSLCGQVAQRLKVLLRPFHHEVLVSGPSPLVAVDAADPPRSFDKGLLARLAPSHGITIIEKEGVTQEAWNLPRPEQGQATAAARRRWGVDRIAPPA
jgi:hypothetical protein